MYLLCNKERIGFYYLIKQITGLYGTEVGGKRSKNRKTHPHQCWSVSTGDKSEPLAPAFGDLRVNRERKTETKTEGS